MYSDFEKTFKTLPQFHSEPPQIVLEYLNSNLPEGLEYVHLKDGCYFLSNISELSFKISQICVSDDAKSLFDDKSTIDDYLKYSINSQHNLEIMPDENGCFIINGKSISAKDIMQMPFKNLKFVNGRFIIAPPPLTQRIKLILSGNGYQIEVEVHRIPNNSIGTRSFSTESSAPFFFKYDIDIHETHKFGGSFSVNADNQTASEIVKLYSIFNAFVCGKGSINNSPLLSRPMDTRKCVPETIIAFWKRVAIVEKAYGIEFSNPHAMTERDARWLEAIYNSIEKGLAAKCICKYSSIDGKGEIPDQLNENIKSGKKMCLISFGDYKTRLLGHDLNLFFCKGLFDFRATSVDYSENHDYVITIDDAEGTKMFKSIMLFRTKEELDSFQQKEDYINTLCNGIEIDVPEEI